MTTFHCTINGETKSWELNAKLIKNLYFTDWNDIKVKKSFTAHLKGVQEEMALYIVEDIQN